MNESTADLWDHLAAVERGIVPIAPGHPRGERAS
jgi:hypothetical protein